MASMPQLLAVATASLSLSQHSNIGAGGFGDKVKSQLWDIIVLETMAVI
jgi:hypothetical protein